MKIFIAIDCETTGLGRYADRIVEIAALAFTCDEHEIISSFQSLINPGIPIPAEATAIHGITDEDVKDSPTFEHVFNSLSDYISTFDDYRLLAHNAQFDAGFINEEICRLGRKDGSHPRYYPVTCTLKVSRHLNRGLRDHSLTGLARYYNLPVVEAHRALADCHHVRNLCTKIDMREYLYYKFNIIRWE